MSATIDEIQAGIKARLDTIQGLHGYATEPESANLPLAFPRLVDWTYDDQLTMGADSTMVYHFDVWVLVRIPDLNRSQTMLNPYISPSGRNSVKLAIEEDVSLGGIVDSCRVTGGGSYGTTEIATVKALAASVRLEVFA